MLAQAVKVIINADDFGLGKDISLAIIEAFEKKYISSATMCANGDYFKEASALGRLMRLEDRIGIHLNLTEGKPLTEGITRFSKFCNQQGHFHGKVNRLSPFRPSEQEAIMLELSAQIERMRQAGLQITHADSHHHVHTGPFIAPLVLSVLKHYQIQSIRIQRNIGSIPMYKKIIKAVFNAYLARHGFSTVERFGGFDDIAFMKQNINGATLEIMVHPCYDRHGNLIDDMTYKNEPEGDLLQEEFASLEIARIYSYSEIWAAS